MPSKTTPYRKAVVWDWSFIQETFDDTAHCYTLTNRQVAALLTPLATMMWSTRWRNAPGNFHDAPASRDTPGHDPAL